MKYLSLLLSVQTAFEAQPSFIDYVQSALFYGSKTAGASGLLTSI